ncbi:Gamma-aminobutyrate:alpha-ketoglutarate aminotransferase [Klebsiella pneumoniae]|uniref:Gamma-aminobutyrate:alpha-ketoglutarate aminotransferase n=1 Tax=Klebsiella pneumoniae TaxID=573 RepID=A0A4P0YI71_KLEPN|nr:Gamma-aminobutyrate:alpha-ketoglutarate aminotransferase [Klebsiella pneumoniae]
MTMAKSLAGGSRCRRCRSRRGDGCASPGGLGGTYAGNPLAVAAAHAVLESLPKSSCASALNSWVAICRKCSTRRAPPVRRSLMSAAGGRWWRWSLTIRKQANRRRNSPARCNRSAGERPAAAELWRLRQRDPLPVSIDYPRRPVLESAGYSGARTEELTSPRRAAAAGKPNRNRTPQPAVYAQREWFITLISPFFRR